MSIRIKQIKKGKLAQIKDENKIKKDVGYDSNKEEQLKKVLSNCNSLNGIF